MAAINFPDSPTVNDEFSVDGRTWRWTGVFWEFVGSTLTQTVLDGKLNLSGGVMTGSLTLSGVPTSDQHATSKAYVDSSLDNVRNNLEQADADILVDITTIYTSLNALDTIEESISTVEGEISAINSSVDTIQDSIVALNSSTETLSLQVQTVSTEVTVLQADLESLATDVSDVSTEVTDLEADILALTDIVDLKSPADSPTFTGSVVLPVTTSIGTVTSSEISHLSGLTSSIQDQIDNKLDSGVASGIYAPLNNPTFGGTVSLPNTTSIGDISSTELGYLNGITSSVQTQLTDLDTTKADIASPTFTGTVSGVTKAHVGLANADNTSDLNKPISTATQTALNAKANLSSANFTGNVEVDGNMIVDGNLTVNGTEFIASATSITIEDNLIQIAHQNAANTVDLGLVVGYNDGAAKHSGIVRDVSDDRWKLFKGVTSEPTTTVNFGQGSLDNLQLNNLIANGVAFSDGTQTKAGVPSLTAFVERTASYTLDTLALQDSVVEMNSTSPMTFTVPTNDALAWPIGASMDILQTNTGEVTIAAASGVTINRTPGNKLRTQWSSATILKRGTNNWILYGDLKA
jgi:archaellum component FlaC